MPGGKGESEIEESTIWSVDDEMHRLGPRHLALAVNAAVAASALISNNVLIGWF